MYKAILMLDRFFLQYEGEGQIEPPQGKLPSKSPALLGLNYPEPNADEIN